MAPSGTVLVTGGAGFIGSHLVERLVERENKHVIVVDNLYTGTLTNIEPLQRRFGERLSFFKHDVREPLTKEILAETEASDKWGSFEGIFHLACAASPVHYQADPIGTLMTCVQGTLNMLELARQKNVRILITSTSEVYGDPELPWHPQPEEYKGNVNCTGPRACYDEGKRAGETLCFDYHRLYGTKIRVARIFNTYGPRMLLNDGRIISNFVVQATKGEPITIYGDGSQTRSFCFVSDTVDGLIRLYLSDEIGPVNVGNPDEHTVLEMAQLIRARIPKCRSEIQFLPRTQDDPMQRKPNISKAQSKLGFKPTVLLDDGLNETIKEFSQRISNNNL